MSKRIWFAASFALLWVVAAPSFAMETAADDWKVSVTGYLWVSSYDNHVEDGSTGQTSDSSASFGDIVGHLSGVPLVGKGEIQYKQAGVIGDLLYMKMSAGRTISRPLLGPIETESDLATTTLTFAGFYRVVQSDSLNLDLLAGLRYMKLKLDFDIQGTRAGFSPDGSASFTEPIVGARVIQRIGRRSSLTGYGDYGGFGGSKTVWQLYGIYNYQLTPKLTASAGYRYFVIEIEKDLFKSDVTLSGPLLALTYHF